MQTFTLDELEWRQCFREAFPEVPNRTEESIYCTNIQKRKRQGKKSPVSFLNRFYKPLSDAHPEGLWPWECGRTESSHSLIWVQQPAPLLRKWHLWSGLSIIYQYLLLCKTKWCWYCLVWDLAVWPKSSTGEASDTLPQAGLSWVISHSVTQTAASSSAPLNVKTAVASHSSPGWELLPLKI